MSYQLLQSMEKHTFIIGMTLFAIITVVGFAIASTESQSTFSSASSNSLTIIGAQQSTTGKNQATYKDGTYAVNGTYTSPGGQEEIGVTLTLANGTIQEIEVQPKATLPMSKRFQEEFSDNYKQLVVGKKISELVLDKVAGSSLTPKGFNDALEQIKSQAQS